MSDGTATDGDLLARIGARLPASPLTVLGTVLAVLVSVRAFADGRPFWQDVVTSALPLAGSVGVVAADRWLIRDGIPVRDRITVFSFALGGFLSAAVATALQLFVISLDTNLASEPLYLILIGGTVGVAAGTVAGAAEVRQREAAREAERQRERFEEFASIVSHDLRNPLEVARGYLQSAFETGEAAHLLQVRESLERMDELIEESLALARQGRVVDDLEPVSLSAVADDAWATVDTGAATLTVAGDRSLRADRTRLQESLENLFRNAVEHAGPDVAVTVEPTAEGFAVADDGPGIAPDEREAVFDRGHTSETDGTGLGLAIVSDIATAHGWTVAVTEGEAGGARFEFATDAE